MANHGAAAALLIASLLVSVALAGAAGARRPLNARIAVNRDASRAYVVKQQEDAAAAVPSLSCSKVHGVQEEETCFSVAQGAGLTQDDFLGFNPNINCAKVFVGQWVCLAATAGGA
ncbi:hypothetical protein SEVIR_5G345900v4 [Setaria viridis]|uniref:LysM domain-containing protein n=2 Tax=Setaria TaxID=4554 RepID=K3XNB1_SETIT|nr:uncharacterized protein LOC101762732 [Setaria italica]XP_034597941.1 uncharacterized protein LOC117858895 isoform X2 [Setaria viridis]RCV27653.1 hypothetical protein SETIT_5G341600v2 [Setaria italica]TKW17132.1 hypothetical protein SEVIR_5G345900v2 [Setaria viridis]